MLFDPIDLLPNLEDPTACRQRAKVCERLARAALDDVQKSNFQKLAAHWREMAQELEVGFLHLM
jgi:hypothetical protein